jgi:hypothetical protein
VGLEGSAFDGRNAFYSLYVVRNGSEDNEVNIDRIKEQPQSSLKLPELPLAMIRADDVIE